MDSTAGEADTHAPVPRAAVAAGAVCGNCGRQLTVADPECCVECGLPVSVSRAAHAAPEPDGVLTSDVPCRQCGYNLRGLRRSGQCPECATLVALSAREDLLCYAEPAYVAHVASGVRWIAFGLALVAVGLIAAVLFLFATLASPSPALDYLLNAASILLLSACLVIGPILMLIGLWRVSCPEPKSHLPFRQDALRLAVRVCLPLGLIGFVVTYTRVIVASPSWLTLVWFGLYILGILGVWAHFRRLRDIAARIPDQRAARRASSLGNMLAGACSIILVERTAIWLSVRLSLLGFPAFGATTSPAAGILRGTTGILGSVHVWLRVASGIASLLLIVFLFSAALYHLKLRVALRRQAEFARKHWCVSTGQA
ncbi:MAG: hypothetical protein KA383_16660 [Phycisphaerae bacterium]|nr:hypothetical protein [Phycisphaerae bacterium]